MSNNKEIICKLIKAKNQEANSYTDQTCYNAAYLLQWLRGRRNYGTEHFERRTRTP